MVDKVVEISEVNRSRVLPEREGRKGENMSEVISKVTKNAREVVFLSLSEFKGHRLIDLRVHVPGDQEGTGSRPARECPWRWAFTPNSRRPWASWRRR